MILRRISKQELFMGSYGTVIIVSRIRGALRPESIKNALSILAQRHPLLSARVVLQNGIPCFEKTGTHTIAFDIIEEAASDKQRLDIYRSALRREIDIRRHLAAVTLVLDCKAQAIAETSTVELYTRVSHLVTDARSGINLHKEILDLCDQNMQAMQACAPALPCPEAIDTIVQNTCGPVGSLSLRNIEKMRRSAGTLPVADTITAERDNYIDVFQRSVRGTVLKTFLQHCKNKGISVHGALCAAHVRALASMIGTDGHASHIICRSAIDVFSRLPEPINPASLFCAVTGCSFGYDVSRQTDLYTLAGNIEADIVNFIKNGDIFRSLMIYKYFSTTKLCPSSLDLKDIPWLDFPVGAFVSNLGRADLPERYGTFQVEHIHAAATMCAGRGFTTVTTLGETMILNFLYTAPRYSREVMHRFVELTMAGLLQH